mmetsp:Transcript_66706/g.145462  ORF Transcript_66706/g.145462 Transcript_66706/m.145462 type:complete len:264 (-) Transcript_66706:187-978(-)|eukprot:CAMPEP_0170594816 /NCGR_PEP_ID=MMETSP0224-20130122/14205_1 /TAXON_ID=285029 /ORGANISM="Togula jolla, Strain CCCM 725" /LENGTH=263 /DNA_ID=CAMNT_0010918905 /DNA_START=68 /DNA_END=859 /DNA_ORIENTATION=+
MSPLPESLDNDDPYSPVLGDKRVFDVVSSESGEVELLPVEGPSKTRLRVTTLADDDVVTIRVFRFIEDYDDASEPWEEGLQNVNSGSLLWLRVHMLPKMHSVRGAKYGKWCTVHEIRIYAKHFKSGYYMCKNGCSMPAKTFGSTSSVKSLVSGEKLAQGYFWFVSPCGQQAGASLENDGWEHISMDGPFDGSVLAEGCAKQSGTLDVGKLQELVAMWQGQGEAGEPSQESPDFAADDSAMQICTMNDMSLVTDLGPLSEITAV